MPYSSVSPVGTLFSDVIEAAGGLKEDAERVISGGPMMGVAQKNLDVPVVKATNAILCLKNDRERSEKKQPCLRCSKCVEACPFGVMVKAETSPTASKCIACGICAKACPMDVLEVVETE